MINYYRICTNVLLHNNCHVLIDKICFFSLLDSEQFTIFQGKVPACYSLCDLDCKIALRYGLCLILHVN